LYFANRNIHSINNFFILLFALKDRKYFSESGIRHKAQDAKHKASRYFPPLTAMPLKRDRGCKKGLSFYRRDYSISHNIVSPSPCHPI
jgi:hypothetical protein